MSTAEETFECDACGRTFPIAQMKEVFTEEGNKERLCPEDLDKRMNEADRVKGGPGEEKQAAAYIDEKAEEAPYGERE